MKTSCAFKPISLPAAELRGGGIDRPEEGGVLWRRLGISLALCFNMQHDLCTLIPALSCPPPPGSHTSHLRVAMAAFTSDLSQAPTSVIN